jgi:succinate dehydrogenase / fumarate reductase, membrane anchor subunit
MIDKSAISNPKTHYGDAKGSTKHFILQRATGALNIAFLIFFAWFIVSLAGAGREGMVEIVRNPVVAVILTLLLVTVALHMRNGMHDVIDDYFDGARHRLAATANTLFAVIIVVVGVGSIAKLVFWG